MNEHEFTSQDNHLIADVSKRMRIFAILIIVSSLLSLLSTAYQLTQAGASTTMLLGGLGGTAIGTLIYIVIAFFTLSASASLQSVATTEANDANHMAGALTSLKRLFGFQYWLIVIGILGIIGTIILSVFLVGFIG